MDATRPFSRYFVQADTDITPYGSCDGSHPPCRFRLCAKARGHRTNGPSPCLSDCFRIAVCPRGVFGALALVHDTYVRRGLMRPNRWRMRVTAYHGLPTSEILVAIRGGELISTLTIVQDSHRGLPMESVFTGEVQRQRKASAALAEVSCLASRPGTSDASPAAMFRLMSLTAQVAVFRGIDQLLIAVHPKHVGFYVRFLGFQEIGRESSYDAVRGNPAVPLVLDFTDLAERCPKAYRRLFSQPFPRWALEQQRPSRRVLSALRLLAWMDNHLGTPRKAAAETDQASAFEDMRPALMVA